MKTVSEILKPTKGTSSYARIAQRANEWLAKQRELGRDTEIKRMSAEQVRRVFEGIPVRVGLIYLEAIGTVQNVDLQELYAASGNYIPPQPTFNQAEFANELRIALYNTDSLNDDQREAVIASVKRILERKRS